MNYASAYNDPAKAYRRNSILNASPEKLVVMLYEGALQHLERARIDLSTKGKERSALVGESLGKAMAIIGELRASLDYENGDQIATELDRLYEFVLDRIYQANVERKSEHIDAVVEVMKTLKEAWDALVPA